MCLFNAHCPEQLASCIARIPDCESLSPAQQGNRQHTQTGCETAIPGGPHHHHQHHQPPLTLRPLPLQQWRDSAAGPISTGLLPQDKGESSTSLFLMLIGLLWSRVTSFLRVLHSLSSSAGWLLLVSRYSLSTQPAGFPPKRLMARNRCAATATMHNIYFVMIQDR